MSRIERALEKASQMRNDGTTAVVVEKPRNEATSAQRPVQRQAASRTITIKTDNRLLATISDQHSAVSEQYRKLKSALVRMTNEDKFRNLLMVTSANSGGQEPDCGQSCHLHGPGI